MPYVASNAELYVGKKVGSGECVAFVQTAAHAPGTGSWKAGIQVMGAGPGVIAKGTVIATMVDGHYPNNGSENHAAIYLDHDPNGIRVVDQWVGQVVHYRTITPRGGQGSPSNDSGAFFVVE